MLKLAVCFAVSLLVQQSTATGLSFFTQIATTHSVASGNPEFSIIRALTPNNFPRGSVGLSQQLLQFRTNTTDKQVIAAVLALPLPFGVLGAHRIFLGAKPIIPVVYIATLGGAFGILPFIDCMVLILSDDITPFMDNSKILMWNMDRQKHQ